MMRIRPQRNTVLLASIALCVMSVFISGCGIPQRFHARLTIKKNGYYEFSCDGTFLDPNILFTTNANPDNAYLREFKINQTLEMLYHVPFITAIEHIHRGLFSISIKEAGTISGFPMYIPSELGHVFSLAPKPGSGKASQFTFSYFFDSSPRSVELSERYIAGLDGIIEIYSEIPLAFNVEPINRDPFSETYRWQITSRNAKTPLIVTINHSPQ